MKKLICLILCASMLCAFACTPALAIKGVTTYEPEDVLSEERLEKESISAWAVEEVEAAYEAGIVPRFSDDPAYKDKITREQFAELVVQMVSVLLEKAPDTEGTPAFSDSSNPSVLQAAAAGIVNGVGDNKFAPKTTTTREQIAAMVYRAIGYIKAESGVDLAPLPGDLSSFTDRDKVAPWAVEGVGALASNGIMNGTSDTTLDPKSGCTVEQSILLVFRVYKSAIA